MNERSIIGNHKVQNNLKLSVYICYEFRFICSEFRYLFYVNIFRYHFTNKLLILVTDVAMVGS